MHGHRELCNSPWDSEVIGVGNMLQKSTGENVNLDIMLKSTDKICQSSHLTISGMG